MRIQRDAFAVRTERGQHGVQHIARADFLSVHQEEGRQEGILRHGCSRFPDAGNGQRDGRGDFLRGIEQPVRLAGQVFFFAREEGDRRHENIVQAQIPPVQRRIVLQKGFADGRDVGGGNGRSGRLRGENFAQGGQAEARVGLHGADDGAEGIVVVSGFLFRTAGRDDEILSLGAQVLPVEVVHIPEFTEDGHVGMRGNDDLLFADVFFKLVGDAVAVESNPLDKDIVGGVQGVGAVGQRALLVEEVCSAVAGNARVDIVIHRRIAVAVSGRNGKENILPVKD